MTIEFDIMASVHTDFSDHCIANRFTEYTVQLSDGPQVLHGARLFFNLVFWKPLLARGLPVTKAHLFPPEALLTPKEIQRINSAVYRHVLIAQPHERDRIQEEMLDGINYIYNVYVTKLAAYNRSVDGFGMARLLQHPKMKEATELDLTVERRLGIQAMEEKIKKVYARTLAVVGDRTVQPNVLYPFWKLGILSEAQLPQVLVACGTRTDINDRMVKEPITSGYMNGLRNMREFSIDSLSGKKSAVYNIVYMSLGQYNNRKQQILATVLRRIYPGDCGSQVLMAFEVHAKNAERVIGKWILADGKLIEVTPEIVKDLVGKIIHMRSVITCRHTDGFCQRCGGRLTDYMPTGVVPGLASMIELMGPAAQLILSNKHVARTTSLIYMLPPELITMAYVERNQVFFRPNIDISQMLIGVPFTCMPRIRDLQHVVSSSALNDQYFSSIDRVMLARSDTGEILAAEVAMTDINKSVPYFSSEMLMYIKNHPERVKEGDVIWIDMADFDKTQPIMGAVVENDSMVRFTKKIEHLFTRGLKRYGSATVAMRDFSTDVYSKLFPHIMHLEVALRASMITSGDDYRLPVVTDPEKVKFGTLPHIIPRRHIGAQIAFQGFPNYITDPHAFVSPKPPGIYDTYLGIPNGNPANLAF